MIFKCLFGEIKLKVGYYDLETIIRIAESNNIPFIAICDNDKDEAVKQFEQDNPLIY